MGQHGNWTGREEEVRLVVGDRSPARARSEESFGNGLADNAWHRIHGVPGDSARLCHLSYIKPQWPYLAPAPYNDVYSKDDLPPVNRRDGEFTQPLMKAWAETRICKSFSRNTVRDVVAPVYIGLIKELDDNMGRLLDYLEESGRMKDNMAVFCSDHGDNMGDHWLGEKGLFYDCSARISLIVYDPRDEADATRETASNQLIEGIDLAPTLQQFLGGPAKPHVF